MQKNEVILNKEKFGYAGRKEVISDRKFLCTLEASDT
jgi:hypothetical protein